MTALMVSAAPDTAELYRRLVRRLETTFAGKIDDANADAIAYAAAELYHRQVEPQLWEEKSAHELLDLFGVPRAGVFAPYSLSERLVVFRRQASQSEYVQRAHELLTTVGVPRTDEAGNEQPLTWRVEQLVASGALDTAEDAGEAREAEMLDEAATEQTPTDETTTDETTKDEAAKDEAAKDGRAPGRSTGRKARPRKATGTGTGTRARKAPAGGTRSRRKPLAGEAASAADAGAAAAADAEADAAAGDGAADAADAGKDQAPAAETAAEEAAAEEAAAEEAKEPEPDRPAGTDTPDTPDTPAEADTHPPPDVPTEAPAETVEGELDVDRDSGAAPLADAVRALEHAARVEAELTQAAPDAAGGVDLVALAATLNSVQTELVSLRAAVDALSVEVRERLEVIHEEVLTARGVLRPPTGEVVAPAAMQETVEVPPLVTPEPEPDPRERRRWRRRVLLVVLLTLIAFAVAAAIVGLVTVGWDKIRSETLQMITTVARGVLV